MRGKVVEKDHYLPQPAGFDVVGTMGSGQSDSLMVQTPVMSPIESWSLTVEGVDKRGNKLKEEIYVTWDVWSSAHGRRQVSMSTGIAPLTPQQAAAQEQKAASQKRIPSAC